MCAEKLFGKKEKTPHDRQHHTPPPGVLIKHSGGIPDSIWDMLWGNYF